MLVFMFYIYGIKAFLFVFIVFFSSSASMKLRCVALAIRLPFICGVFSPTVTHLCHESPESVCGVFRLLPMDSVPSAKKKKYKEKKALPIFAFDLIEQTAIFVKKQ